MAAKRSHGGGNVPSEGRGSIGSSCSDGGSLSSSSDDDDHYIPQSCRGKQDTKKRRRLALTKPAKDYSLSVSRGDSCDEDDDGCNILSREDDPPDRGSRHHRSSSVQDPSSTDTDQVIIKPDFDTSYGLQDLLTLSGSLDTVIDMPLFHEVDSLMNIKHEDHLNDTVFYLPMTYPLEGSLKVELADNIQVTPVSPPDILKPPSGTTGSSQHYMKDRSKEGNAVNSRDNAINGQCISMIKNSTEILASSCKGTKGQQCSTSALEHMLVTGGAVCAMESHLKDQIQASSEKNLALSDTGSEEEGGKAVRRMRGRAHSHPGTMADPNLDTLGLNPSSGYPGSTGDSPIGSPASSSGSGCSRGEISSEGLSEDSQEIDRFVICSDITMECVLCSFSTDSYSAFKSHIICSHPCWRITKKLSKNRLLVEKSVRSSGSGPASGSGSGINTKLVQALTISSTNNVVSTAPSHPTTPLKTTAGSRGSKKDNPDGTRSKRHERNPRKKQLLERNKRLFKCTLCLRLFVFEGSVVNHVTDYHFQGRPYDYIHISNNHGLSFGPIYRCQQQSCYFSCESEDELERHQLERHTQVIYRCQLCGFTADSAAAVHTHGLRLHQQQLMCSDLNSPASS